MKSEIGEDNRQKRSLSIIIALAVISLLAGASVSTSVDELMEPRYVEDNPYAGVVDDAVGDATWDMIDEDKKGFKGMLKSFLSDKIEISEEDRMEHLEKRVEANGMLVIALQYCIDNEECNADSESLTMMKDSIEVRAPSMMEKVDDDKEDWYDCKTRELWTDEKQEWCDNVYSMMEHRREVMDKAHFDWDDLNQDELTSKLHLTENAAIAISYCIANSDCAGLDISHDGRHSFNSILTQIGTEMAQRYGDYQECFEGEDCEREDKKERSGPKGLIAKFSEKFDREGKTKPLPVRHNMDFHKFEVTQEMCESRRGTWNTIEDKSYCEWPKIDYQEVCYDDDEKVVCGDDDTNQESSNEDSLQEECEANGGTWSEDRQECY
ncbi:MAG: hypothetical protein ACI9O1_000401 [Candidatus Thalassarchaeaceae archaeon]|jgi:hypothetical protein